MQKYININININARPNVKDDIFPDIPYGVNVRFPIKNILNVIKIQFPIVSYFLSRILDSPNYEGSKIIL